jgi:nitrate reductase NapE component
MFKLVLASSAILVAGCAAYFSVQGLATLYAGSFIAVCVMAGSLEFGKLVAASYLHRYWKKTSVLLKTYLTISVITLMAITSLGIFGFLTSAFQKSHVKIEIINVQKESLNIEKESFQKEINNLTSRISTLNDIRVIQEKRVEEAGNYKVPREQAYSAIDKANHEIKDLSQQINGLNDKIKNINNKNLELKSEEVKSSDIGTLKFVAELFNTNIETVVKWFTIIIVLVFDPLAVSLVLAYTNTIQRKEILEESSNEDQKENKFNKILKPFKMKYKDQKNL